MGVTSAETNIKWNGAAYEYFHPCWGIRQGDLIFPCLFVLCLDRLPHIIMHDVDQGDWNPI